MCGKPTAKAVGKPSRKINGVELCASCYQYLWEKSKETGETMGELFDKGVAPPRRPLPRIATKCAREGCGTELPENAGPKVRRTIGLFHVCRNCYETVWEHSKRDGMSLEDAFHNLKPKGWKPEPPRIVRCCLSWCDKEIEADAEALVVDGLYACGACRKHLKHLAKRTRYQDLEWQDLAKEGVKGSIPQPGEMEQCSMPWCDKSEVAKHRGPNGEMVCHACAEHIRRYQKKHNLTFDEAFHITPAPRKNTGRPRKCR